MSPLRRSFDVSLFSFLILVLVLFSTGCGDSSGSPSTGGSSGGPGGQGRGVGSAPTAASFVYGTYGPAVLGGRIQADGRIIDVPMTTDPFSGDTGFFTGTDGLITSIATDPKGRFVYTLDIETSSFGMPIGTNGIGAFTVDRSSGALTRISGSPYPVAFRDGAVVEDGNGKFLFVASAQNNSIDTYSIDQATGALTKLTTLSAASGSQLAASWDGRFLFSGGSSQVTSYSIDSTTGALTQAGTIPVQNPGPIFLSYSGNFLYSMSTSGITGMTVSNTGQLTVTQANFPVTEVDGGLPRRMIATSRDDRFAYVASSSGENVGALQAYSVDPTTGALGNLVGSQITMDVGESPLQLSLDYNGRFLYATFTGINMQTFPINPDGSIGSGTVNTGFSALADFFELSP